MRLGRAARTSATRARLHRLSSRELLGILGLGIVGLLAVVVLRSDGDEPGPAQRRGVVAATAPPTSDVSRPPDLGVDPALLADLRTHDVGETYRVLRYEVQLNPGVRLIDDHGRWSDYAYVGSVARPAVVTVAGRPALAFHGWDEGLQFLFIDDFGDLRDRVWLFDPNVEGDVTSRLEPTGERLSETLEVTVGTDSDGCLFADMIDDGQDTMCLTAELAPND